MTGERKRFCWYDVAGDDRLMVRFGWRMKLARNVLSKPIQLILRLCFWNILYSVWTLKKRPPKMIHSRGATSLRRLVSHYTKFDTCMYIRWENIAGEFEPESQMFDDDVNHHLENSSLVAHEAVRPAQLPPERVGLGLRPSYIDKIVLAACIRQQNAHPWKSKYGGKPTKASLCAKFRVVSRPTTSTCGVCHTTRPARATGSDSYQCRDGSI